MKGGGAGLVNIVRGVGANESVNLIVLNNENAFLRHILCATQYSMRVLLLS